MYKKFSYNEVTGHEGINQNQTQNVKISECLNMFYVRCTLHCDVIIQCRPTKMRLS